MGSFPHFRYLFDRASEVPHALLLAAPRMGLFLHFRIFGCLPKTPMAPAPRGRHNDKIAYRVGLFTRSFPADRIGAGTLSYPRPMGEVG